MVKEGKTTAAETHPPPARAVQAAGNGLAPCSDVQPESLTVRWREQFYFTNFHVLYCSHETQTTCWDHPKMTELYQSLGKISLPVVWVFFPIK